MLLHRLCLVERVGNVSLVNAFSLREDVGCLSLLASREKIYTSMQMYLEVSLPKYLLFRTYGS